MEIIKPTETKLQAHENVKKSVLIFISVVVIIFGAIFISFLQLQSPKVVPATDASTTFSAERAFSYLEKFATAPHPLGSKEHDKVRDYLIGVLEDLGVEPEIQKANSLYPLGSWVLGGTVENIIAKIEGTNSTNAIMLVAHYDSVPGGPGVSDDGAGVSAILETVRALKEMKPLQNDVIILLSDGEENGLLGAKAFVEEHPWVKDVGLVLNFEARGNKGPSFMFETSDNNGWIVKEFVKAAPTPVAQSFIYSLYKLMPNDTDLTIFKAAGLNGLNFAFGEGVGHYHTTSDNLEELSKESLQHHGEYMLSLVRHFGDMDLNQTKDGNQLFFNIFGSTMITYSEDLVIPITMFVVILFVLTMVHGYRRKKLSILGTLASLLVMIGGMAGAFAIGLGLWRLLTAIFSEKAWILETNITFGTIYLISFSIIVFAFINFLYMLAHKKIKVGSLTMGALLIWLVLLIITSFLLKAGSYVFAWPLLFGLIGVNIVILLKENSWKSYFITAGFAIPAFLILSPVIYLIQALVSMNLANVLMILVFLLGTLLIPIFSTLKLKSNWMMPSFLFSAGLVVMISNSMNINNTPTAEHPKVSDITYYMNEDTSKAYWAASYALDEYTSNYMSEDVKEGNTSEFFPLLNWDVAYSEAELYDMKAPSVTVRSDELEAEKRTIEYEIKTNRQAEEIIVKSLAKMNVSQLIINGKEVELEQHGYTKEQPLQFTYIVGQAGAFHVEVTVDANDSIEWIVADRSYRIPEVRGNRPPEFSTYGDHSFVMKTIRD
ncbi:M20/M25/M40 family metallo-hydrolase [Bacillus sp. Bva_UNVM-123]|uniref:M20/M25/M40 family metallo-hydrolase n=1 Tax=Bacillus sp. Bva_UNVM-123 TaxID=2829798 RepID=UPI00391F5E61